MKLGRRWLYVLWIAATVLWHQAGASSSVCHLATISQWDLAKTATPPPTADFTLQATDILENQSIDKKPAVSTGFLCSLTELKALDLTVTGAVRDELPQGASATTVAWHLVRGPPATA